MSIGAHDLTAPASLSVRTVFAPAVRLLASEEMLLLAYVVSVLTGFKPFLYLSFAMCVGADRWRADPLRILVSLALIGATAWYYLQADTVMPALTFALALSGLFSTGRDSAPRDPLLTTARHALVLLTVVLLVGSVAFSSVGEDVDPIASHNFIPIVGLYVMLVAEDTQVRFRVVVSLLLGACAFVVGSRTGAVALFLVTLVMLPRRLGPMLVLAAAIVLVSVADVSALTQFQRNYEVDDDPRLLIWAEVYQSFLDGTFYRQTQFDFMDTYGLSRNFHNSLLEALYRVGPLTALLLLMHLRAAFARGVSGYRRIVLLAMLLKAMSDTFLWFNPIDLLLYRRYRARD
jgi:hypothetical protein